MSSQPPPPAGPGPTPGLLASRLAILLPYTDLLINQQTDTKYPIAPSFQPTLSLTYGLGPTEPKVLQLDKNGSLQVTTAGQAGSGGVTIFDDPAFTTLKARVVGGVTTGIGGALAIVPYLDGRGGGIQEQASASAAALILQPAPPAALVASPGQWAAFNNAGLGAASSASRAAGGAGVRHVITGYQVIISSQVAPAAGQVTINLRDGASGAGTILEALNVSIPAALYAPIIIARGNLMLIGSAATAFTIEQSAAYAAVEASINFEGFDVS